MFTRPVHSHAPARAGLLSVPLPHTPLGCELVGRSLHHLLFKLSPCFALFSSPRTQGSVCPSSACGCTGCSGQTEARPPQYVFLASFSLLRSVGWRCLVSAVSVLCHRCVSPQCSTVSLLFVSRPPPCPCALLLDGGAVPVLCYPCVIPVSSLCISTV